MTTNWPVGPVNVYLIYGEKLTLVDTGLKNETTWRELRDGLSEKGLSLHDIEQIVITHHHNDHAGMLDWIISEHEVRVYAHPYAKPFLVKDRHYLKWSDLFFKQLFYEFGVPNEVAAQKHRKSRNRKQKIDLDLRIVNEGEAIPGLPGWKVIETKGHSQDHISLLHEPSRQFICGDHLIKGMPAGIFIDAPYENEARAKPMLQYINGLNRCLTMDISLAFSGHGPVIRNISEVIDEQLRRIENRGKRIKKVLGKNRLTGFELIQAMYPKRYEQSIGLFVSETMSMLDVLEERQEVIKEKRNGVLTYRLT